ncbi:MAG: hypothetical protein PHN88_02150 [Ignavibacteria bacterium]|nr:hypothetical protein [Ignavibacteria bacterium]
MSASKYIRLNNVWDTSTGRYSRTSLRKIPDYGNYLADKKGRVYVRNKYGHIQQLTQFLSPNSRYLRVYITKNGIKRNYPVQNLIISAFRYYNPDNISVIHKDKNFLNNRLSNLKLREMNRDVTDMEKLREYQIEQLEENLRERIGYEGKKKIWKDYKMIKKTKTRNTVINWLNIVLKNL